MQALSLCFVAHALLSLDRCSCGKALLAPVFASVASMAQLCNSDCPSQPWTYVLQVCGMIHQHRVQLPTDVYANLLIYAVQQGSNSAESFERSQVLHFLSILQQDTVNWSALLSGTDKSRLCTILLEQKAWHERLDIVADWLDQPKVCLCPCTNLSTYSIAAPKLNLALQSVCMQVC